MRAHQKSSSAARLMGKEEQKPQNPWIQSAFLLLFFFLWEHFSPPGNISLFKPGFVLLKLYKMCGSGSVFLAGGLFPGPPVPGSLSLADVTMRGGGAVACPRKAFPANRASKRLLKSRCFCLRLIGAAGTIFLPVSFSSARGSCLPGTQIRTLMRFMAEPGLGEGGLTDTRMKLLTNLGESWPRAILRSSGAEMSRCLGRSLRLWKASSMGIADGSWFLPGLVTQLQEQAANFFSLSFLAQSPPPKAHGAWHTPAHDHAHGLPPADCYNFGGTRHPYTSPYENVLSDEVFPILVLCTDSTLALRKPWDMQITKGDWVNSDSSPCKFLLWSSR